MAAPIEYITWDETAISIVRCMNCNKVIATRKTFTAPNGTTFEKLVHQSHMCTMRVILQDNSYSNILLCKTCQADASTLDLDDLNITQNWGWQKEFEFINDRDATQEEIDRMTQNKDIVKRG